VNNIIEENLKATGIGNRTLTSHWSGRARVRRLVSPSRTNRYRIWGAVWLRIIKKKKNISRTFACAKRRCICFLSVLGVEFLRSITCSRTRALSPVGPASLAVAAVEHDRAGRTFALVARRRPPNRYSEVARVPLKNLRPALAPSRFHRRRCEGEIGKGR
jgi:hypothetical protein